MARPVKGGLRSRPQQEGAEGPEQDPQQEDQPDMTEGKDIADYNLDVGYVGSEPKAKHDAQEQRVVDPYSENCENGNAQKWYLLPEDDVLGTVYRDPGTYGTRT